MAKKKSQTVSDAVEIAIQELGDSSALRKRIAEEKLNIRVAQMIYDARHSAGLTQKQLAELVGSKQQVIARLEDADYDGHSLTMLQRIAAALACKLEVAMIPVKPRRKRA